MTDAARQDVRRRLAAILAADVEGYSRLMSLDEVGTLRALTTCREVMDRLIAGHGGRIANTAGDSVLAEFLSAVDAVQCAVALQEQLAQASDEVPEDRRVRFRVGIHVGDVMVREGDLFGDGVNIAARLQALAAPGGVSISGAAHEHVRKALPLAYADLGLQQVKNLDEPVRAYAVAPASGAGSCFPRTQAQPPPLPDKPSIAVLPFQNMSGDSEQEYFADGIVEDITTALSRLRWLFVIARNSSFTYKGRAVDVKQVGRELGVRYVLEGSVRKAGNRVRITGQLIDASTGAHLWADRFDGELANIFDLQDRVAASVVGVITPTLEQVEMERAKRKPTGSLEAYDYFLRGMAAFYSYAEAANEEALAHFSRAIELDPDYASAYGMAARCYLQRKGFGWVADREREIAETERLARRAADLGRDDAVALCAAGFSLIVVVGELVDGAALIERALALNPNLGWVWQFGALAKAYLGEPEAAIEHAARAMRLSPQDPQMFGMQVATAFGHFFAGRYAEALSWAEAAIRERPNFFMATCVAAASGALVGRHTEAEKAMARLRRLDPTLRLSDLRHLIPIRRPEDFELWAEGLRLAGLPE